MSERVLITLTVNGQERAVDVDPSATLLRVLRDELQLTGTKAGCEAGDCGSCTVIVDGAAERSCQTTLGDVAGKDVITIEGLATDGRLHPLQEEFADGGAFQCGYCTPGQIMAVEGLLRANPEPSADEIRTAVSGNLCRCGTYRQIARAAHRAAELRRAAPLGGGGS